MAGCDHKSKQGDLGAQSLQSLRRQVRLATAASEQSEILRIKREGRALMKRTAVAPAAGNKRRKKVIKKTLLPRAAIEHILSNPYNPLKGFREEKLAMYTQETREAYFRQKALMDNVLEYHRALIKQFRKKGYAEDYKEVEVTDDEQDNN